MKCKVITAQNGLYGTRGFIKNCIEEDGQHYFMVKLKGRKGVHMLPVEAVEIIEEERK